MSKSQQSLTGLKRKIWDFFPVHSSKDSQSKENAEKLDEVRVVDNLQKFEVGCIDLSRCKQERLSVIVNAVAGAGKTTQLFHHFQKFKDLKFLYLAFNKQTKESAKTRVNSLNLSNVFVHTFHSFALEVCRPLGWDLDERLMQDPKAFETAVMDFLCENATTKKITKWNKKHCSTVLKCLRNFCHSEQLKVSEKHCSFLQELLIKQEAKDSKKTNRSGKKSQSNKLLSLNDCIRATQALVDIAFEKKFRLDFDLCVKMLHLYLMSCDSREMHELLESDLCCLDEAQDVFPVVYAIVQCNKKWSIVATGDEFQQINQWNHAVNSLGRFLTNQHSFQFGLFQTHRFGQNLASILTAMLLVAGDPLPQDMQGRQRPTLLGKGPSDASVLSLRQRTHTNPENGVRKAVLAYKNATLIQYALDLLGQYAKPGQKMPIIGMCKSLASYLRALIGLQHKIEAQPYLSKFLKKKAEWERDTETLGKLSCLEKFQHPVLVKLESLQRFVIEVENVSKPNGMFDVILCTVHASKGEEWQHVDILEDIADVFSSVLNQVSSEHHSHANTKEQLCVVYTALTRPKDSLCLPPILFEWLQECSKTRNTLIGPGRLNSFQRATLLQEVRNKILGK